MVRYHLVLKPDFGRKQWFETVFKGQDTVE